MLENVVVQFNENHKWCGCLGIINESKPEIAGAKRLIITLGNKSPNID